jgi:hypothetical protein
MKHLTVVYALPDGFDASEITSHQHMSACSRSHAIDSKNKLLQAMIYVQKQVESGEEISMSKINEAIRSAQA